MSYCEGSQCCDADVDAGQTTNSSTSSRIARSISMASALRVHVHVHVPCTSIYWCNEDLVKQGQFGNYANFDTNEAQFIQLNVLQN